MMQFLNTVWEILTGHKLFSFYFFVGFALYLIGGRLSYIVAKQKFNRTNSSGVLEFKDFKEKNKKTFIWRAMDFVGKMGLWIWVICLIALLINHYS